MAPDRRARQEQWRLYAFIAKQLRSSAEIALSAATEAQLHETRLVRIRRVATWRSAIAPRAELF